MFPKKLRIIIATVAIVMLGAMVASAKGVHRAHAKRTHTAVTVSSDSQDQSGQNDEVDAEDSQDQSGQNDEVDAQDSQDQSGQNDNGDQGGSGD